MFERSDPDAKYGFPPARLQGFTDGRDEGGEFYKQSLFAWIEYADVDAAYEEVKSAARAKIVKLLRALQLSPRLEWPETREATREQLVAYWMRVTDHQACIPAQQIFCVRN